MQQPDEFILLKCIPLHTAKHHDYHQGVSRNTNKIYSVLYMYSFSISVTWIITVDSNVYIQGVPGGM